ncbi:putative tail component [Pseudomonas phage hairong]|nr:putative tail component [Pseudomonas phage hairong]
MGLTVKNLAAVMLNFARAEEKVAKGSLAQLRKSADKIVKLARDYAPVDTEDLEGAIEAQEGRERTSLGRFGATTIDVGVNISKLNLEEHGGYDYSIRMHEDPNYNLGPRSQAKQSGSGKQVGYKYLQRAMEDLRVEITRDMAEAVRRSV